MLNKNHIAVSIGMLLAVVTMGCASEPKETSTNDRNPEIVRIEGYSYVTGKEFITEDEEVIDTISKLVDNVPEMDEEQEEIKDFTEDYYLEFYKPSVTVVESEDTDIFKLVFSESTNTVKMVMLPSSVLGDSLDIYFEISDEDKAYIDKLFEE